MKKIISLILAVMMAFGVCTAAFAKEDAGCDCGEDPTIFVNGIGETIYTDPERENTLIPTDVGAYLKAISAKDLFNLFTGIAFKKYDKVGDALISVGSKIIGGTGCDKDGNFPEGQGVDFEYPEVTVHGKDKRFNFTYDWRRSPIDIAGDLDAFIDYICEETGHKHVKLIGFSMGSAVTLAYLSKYGHGKVSGVVAYAGCQSGTCCCGEPFCLQLAYDGPAAVRYLAELTFGTKTSKILGNLFAVLYKTGLLDKVGNTLIDIVNSQGARTYSELVPDTFVATPGLFSLIPAEYYETALNNIFGGKEKEYAGLISKIEEYHNVQMNAYDIYDGLIADGVNFGVVSKYGLQHFAFMEDYENLSDTVIDTKYTSMGAACAPRTGVLSDEQAALKDSKGVSRVSPDRKINAATCRYPEYTWFIRNLPHSENCDDAYALIKYILYSDKQVTVDDNPAYPQFMLYIPESDSLEILTEDNIPDEIDYIEKSLITLNVDFAKSLF